MQKAVLPVKNNQVIATDPRCDHWPPGRHRFWHYDTSAPAVKAKGYDTDLSKAGVTGPGLIVIDQGTGKVLGVTALPADKAGVSAYLKTIVGG